MSVDHSKRFLLTKNHQGKPQHSLALSQYEQLHIFCANSQVRSRLALKFLELYPKGCLHNCISLKYRANCSVRFRRPYRNDCRNGFCGGRHQEVRQYGYRLAWFLPIMHLYDVFLLSVESRPRQMRLPYSEVSSFEPSPLHTIDTQNLCRATQSRNAPIPTSESLRTDSTALLQYEWDDTLQFYNPQSPRPQNHESLPFFGEMYGVHSPTFCFRASSGRYLVHEAYCLRKANLHKENVTFLEHYQFKFLILITVNSRINSKYSHQGKSNW